MYIWIQRKREDERSTYTHTFTHIYIYIHIYRGANGVSCLKSSIADRTQGRKTKHKLPACGCSGPKLMSASSSAEYTLRPSTYSWWPWAPLHRNPPNNHPQNPETTMTRHVRKKSLERSIYFLIGKNTFSVCDYSGNGAGPPRQVTKRHPGKKHSGTW